MILLDREGLIKYVSNVQRFTLFKSPQWPNLMSISVVVYLGDNCIQNVYLGRYIIWYMVGNSVLRRRASWTFKSDFRPYIQLYTFPNENLDYGSPHSNAILELWF